jgi:adenylate cyclase class 2
MEEIEVKFLNIEPDSLENKLENLGAKKQFDRIYRRSVYDYPDLRLNNQSAWVRVRDEGDKITMGFKQRLSPSGLGNDAGMKEVEIVVSSFDFACEFLKSIGLKRKFYEENRRIRYIYEEIEFDIDFWPLLNPYLEIEAQSWEEIDRGIKLLGLGEKNKKICSAFQIYEMNGINENDYDILTFDKQVKKKLKY